ncbi:hypothetical protein FRX31_027437 [Thalictrum thalictroides]|uniref:Uncharacterized protein n=1 Tax=Thalictrum thalictroides TaxID=46969 RepID=A0A7J6VD01_THATH|nr:hypothetical protein FRX31_027437 [Thalictrum thalictroides]
MREAIMRWKGPTKVNTYSEDCNKFGHSSIKVSHENTWYERAGILLDEPVCASNIMMDETREPRLEDSYCMDAHEVYNFRDFEQLVDYKECDFSLYNEDDPPMSCNHGDNKNDKDKGGVGSPPDN